MTGVIATIPKLQFSSAVGLPLSGGTLTSYLAGTTTPVITYQDQALSIANTNPIALDSRGECLLWLDSTKVYKFVLKNALGVVQWTVDNITNSTAVASAFATAFATALDVQLRADLAASSGSSIVGHMPSGTGSVATTVAVELTRIQGAVRNVKDAPYLAIGDGASHPLSERFATLAAAQAVYPLATALTQEIDWAALQTAASAGGRVLLPPGLYIVDKPIALSKFAYVEFIGAGFYVSPQGFVAPDWQGTPPSWAAQGSTLEYRQGLHGPLFEPIDKVTLKQFGRCKFSGVIFRVGQARTTADVFVSSLYTANFCIFENCTFQNIENFCTNSVSAWGAMLVTNCTFIGMNQVFVGSFVDSIIIGNDFISILDACVAFSSGGGYTQIVGNRFEFGEANAIRMSANARDVAITGNIFDSFGAHALNLSGSDTTVVSGNQFYNNGRTASAATNAHIYLGTDTRVTITGNTFKSSGTPSSIMEVVGYTSGLVTVLFYGNDIKTGCISSRAFLNLLGTALNAVDFGGSIDLPTGALAATATDDMVLALFYINAMSLAPVNVYITEDRNVVTTRAGLSKINLVGKGARTITNSGGGSVGCDTFNNITYGAAFTRKAGLLYSTVVPAVGSWLIGQRVFNIVPAVGQPKSWVCTVSGAPGTWVSEGNL